MMERLATHRSQQEQQQQGDQGLLDRVEQGQGLGPRRKSKNKSKSKEKPSPGVSVAAPATVVTDLIALSVYGDHCAPAVEAKQLLEGVREYLLCNLPSLDRSDVDAQATQRYATAAAIQTRIMVAPDGEPFPLSCWQRLRSVYPLSAYAPTYFPTYRRCLTLPTNHLSIRLSVPGTVTVPTCWSARSLRDGSRRRGPETG